MSVAFADPSTVAGKDYGGYAREAVTVNFHIIAISEDKSFPPFYIAKTKAQRGRKLAVVV